MKRIIAVILCLTIVGSALVGCGKETEEASAPVETVEEPTAEPEMEEISEPVEEEPVEEAAPEEEEVVEEPSFAETGLTEEYALDKLDKAYTLYKSLTVDNTDESFELECLSALATAYTLGIDVTTKDGINLLTTLDSFDSQTWFKALSVMVSVPCTDFYNYINNNEDHFDYKNYIESNTYNDLVKLIEMTDEEEYQADSYTMMSLLIWMDTLISTEGEISVRNITDNITVDYPEVRIPDGTVSTVAWQCDIYKGEEDTGLKLEFDAEGNLLNLCTDDPKVEKIINFDTSQWEGIFY